MDKSMYTCCKIYISEARNKSALDSIERAAKLFPEAVLVNKFEDEFYNRVAYTLVSKAGPTLSSDLCPLKDAVFTMMKAAYEAIDFELHSGNHPRVGVVDHVSLVPMASTSLEQVAKTAKALAADVGSILKVPTFTCGAAHEYQRSLYSIRSELDYFKPNVKGYQWSGAPQSDVLPLAPDEGPAHVTRSKGIVIIEATRWFNNYNVPVFCSDIDTVRRIAKGVSGRGGGLPSVCSLALVHPDCIEVACSLLEPSVVSGDQVHDAVEWLAAQEGVTVGKGYFTDLSQEDQIQTFLNLSCS